MANTEDIRCNIVTMGKTGAGKSSLLNYLFGSNFETGVGKPVTGEGLYKFDGEINGQKIRVYDSWGIEADKVDRWKQILFEQAVEHGAAKNPEDWFHAVIYCVQAGGARVESIDTWIISYFVKQGYRVVVALTKIDQISEEEEDVMKKTIEEEVKKMSGKAGRIKVISVTSVEKKTRAGEVKPIGRDELIEAVMKGWIEALKDRLPYTIVAHLVKRLDEYGKDLISYVSDQHVSGRPEGNDELVSSCKNKINARMEKLLEEDIKEVAGLLVEQSRKIGLSLMNVFNVSADGTKAADFAFNRFFNENSSSQGKRTASYIATLGLRALYLSKSKKHREQEKDRIEGVIGDAIDAQKDFLEDNVVPILEKIMEKIIGADNA